MRKLFVILLAISFIACEGPMGPMGQKGEKGEPGYGTKWHVTSFTVAKSEWKLVGSPGELNSYFYVDKPLKELTEFVYDEGSVIAYIETDKGFKNGMPYVLHLGEAEGSNEFLWTQTYDFDFHEGGITFYVTYSDFNTQIRPDIETFHVVLMW